MEVVRPWIRVEGSFPVELTPPLSNGVRTLAAVLIRMLDPPNQANIKLSIDISRSSSFLPLIPFLISIIVSRMQLSVILD